MAKAHDDWLAALGGATGKPAELPGTPGTAAKAIEKLTGVRAVAEGYAFRGKLQKKLALAKKNFRIGYLPCYAKGSVQLTVQGELSATQPAGGPARVGDALTVTVGGIVEAGPGATSARITAGGYGAITLSAEAFVPFEWADGSGWHCPGVLLRVLGRGAVGVKIEVGGGGFKARKLGVAAESKDWELYVVECRGWKNGWFASVEIRDGKDMARLMHALDHPEQVIEDVVDAVAPDSVKQAAVDAAAWAADSDGAAAIAGGVGVALGDDGGHAIEKIVARATGGRTGREQTEALNAQLAAEEALRREFDTLTRRHRIGEGQALAGFRTRDEWNKLKAERDADLHAIANGEEPKRRWVALADALERVVFERRKQQALAQSREQGAMTRAQWMQRVEEIRVRAEGNGNWLSSRVPADPTHPVHRLFELSRRVFLDGIALRNQAAVLEGDACEAAAKGAIAKFQQAFAGYVKGQQLVKAAAALKQAEPA
jgi:hypothetical protein